MLSFPLVSFAILSFHAAIHLLNSNEAEVVSTFTWLYLISKPETEIERVYDNRIENCWWKFQSFLWLVFLWVHGHIEMFNQNLDSTLTFASSWLCQRQTHSCRMFNSYLNGKISERKHKLKRFFPFFPKIIGYILFLFLFLFVLYFFFSIGHHKLMECGQWT